MALVSSNMMALNTIAPPFHLENPATHQRLSLEDCLNSHEAIVIAFICNHCPFVKHIGHKLSEVAKKYQEKNIAFVAINSNDPAIASYDSPERMPEFSKVYDFSFPYLFDASQEVAKAYGAACTPDFFVFNKNKECVYRGRFDNSTPHNGLPVTGTELTDVLDCIMNNNAVSQTQHPSIGCSIKWREEQLSPV